MKTTMTERTFDRVPSRDPRNNDYPIRGIAAPVRRRKVWTPGTVLDQGREGACVGFAWTAELLATPVRIPNLDNAAAQRLYKNAQQIDEWAGEAYSGTSVLAGAKVCQRQGFIREYRWGRTVPDLIAGLQRGPCVLGVEWYDSAYETLPSGFLDLTGSVVGGHAILCYGYLPAMAVSGTEAFALRNSWSANWGLGGSGLVRADDMDRWLSRGGEICLPTKRSFGPTRAE